MAESLKSPHASQASSRAVAWSSPSGQGSSASFVDNRPGSSREALEALFQPRWRAHVELSSPAADPSAGETPVQLLRAKVKVTGGSISSASMDGSAPATNLRGKRGDHSTPYVTFLHMALNNVQGRTLASAVSNLKITIGQIQALPGYVDASPSYKNALDTYATSVIQAADNAMVLNESVVENLMVGVVTLRNAVPGTAFKNTPSTGGQNEANTAGGLHHAEAQVRNGTWTTQADFGGNLMVNVWDTFDFAAPGAQTDQGWADLFNQHMSSIEASYPDIFEIKKIYTRADMKNYLVATVLPHHFSAGTAGNIAALL